MSHLEHPQSILLGFWYWCSFWGLGRTSWSRKRLGPTSKPLVNLRDGLAMRVRQCPIAIKFLGLRRPWLLRRAPASLLALQTCWDLQLEGLEGDYTYAEESWKLGHTIWRTIKRSAAPVVLKLLRSLYFLSPLCSQFLRNSPSHSSRIEDIVETSN